MKHRWATPEGRAVYAQRKSTVEPVFGIVKSVLGFRQFHLRGLKNVSGEWTLVSMAWNLKRLFHLRQQQIRSVTDNGLKRRPHRRNRLTKNHTGASFSQFVRQRSFSLF